MCTIPPPPPPPPQHLGKKNSNKEAYNDDVKRILNTDICEWASHEIFLWDACASREICMYKPPFQFKYRDFESIMQVGPTCGLVALSMMLNGEVAPDELLNITKLEGYSSNGEMLSCKDMLKLAEKAIGLVEIDNITCSLKRGVLYSEEIIQELLDGAILLVPHGKSKYLSAWLLEDLYKSNRNLWEFSPKKMDDGLLYVIPEGGIGGENGLRDQFLLFKGFSKY